jgi:hypothetical protein
VDEATGWSELSPAELGVAAGPGGSLAAAVAWVAMVLDGRLAEAWPSTGFCFRLHLTRHWAWSRRFELHAAGHDPLALATELADRGPAHPCWRAFAVSQRTPGAETAGRAGWVAAGPPEPLAPDLEVVRLVAADCAGTGRAVPPLTLVLRLGRHGWAVEGHGHRPAQPRWPPGSP